MKRGLRNTSLLLAMSIVIPALYASERPASLPTERVYAMTNDATKNEVFAFALGHDGAFHSAGSFATGGRGSGGVTDPLESQGSLTISQDHSLLFAVNAGSGTVSSFRIEGDRLAWADQQPTDGAEPVSVAQHGQFVYVLNQGGFGGVAVFSVSGNGHLKKVANSTTLLSATGLEGASIAVSPDGRLLAVVERLAGTIDIFHILPNGTLSSITSTADPNPGGFSAIFSQGGELLMSETGPSGVAAGSTISSFTVNSNATVSPISSAVPTEGAANCWLAITPNGKFVYTSNSGSDNVSGFNVAQSGTLTPIGGAIVAANPAGSHNVDIAVSADSNFVYTQNSNTGTIRVWSINSDGTLKEIDSISGIPAMSGTNGLAAD
ncbi:MAG: beta-propeller fold lactonase family protein [Acidobacteriaceae bacterium]